MVCQWTVTLKRKVSAMCIDHGGVANARDNAAVQRCESGLALIHQVFSPLIPLLQPLACYLIASICLGAIQSGICRTDKVIDVLPYTEGSNTK